MKRRQHDLITKPISTPTTNDSYQDSCLPLLAEIDVTPSTQSLFNSSTNPSCPNRSDSNLETIPRQPFVNATLSSTGDEVKVPRQCVTTLSLHLYNENTSQQEFTTTASSDLGKEMQSFQKTTPTIMSSLRHETRSHPVFTTNIPSINSEEESRARQQVEDQLRLLRFIRTGPKLSLNAPSSDAGLKLPTDGIDCKYHHASTPSLTPSTQQSVQPSIAPYSCRPEMAESTIAPVLSALITLQNRQNHFMSTHTLCDDSNLPVSLNYRPLANNNSFVMHNYADYQATNYRASMMVAAEGSSGTHYSNTSSQTTIQENQYLDGSSHQQLMDAARTLYQLQR